jgi:DNA-binding SARP family transcriptional activator
MSRWTRDLRLGMQQFINTTLYIKSLYIRRGNVAGLNLYLLGSPHVEFEGEPFEIRRRKAMALLLYLAVQGERQPRDALAALLWPENSQQSAHKAFRRDLSELNLALERDWLDTDRTSVGLRAGFWLDVTQFQRYLAQESADPESLMAAANLYRDDFLTGFTLPDCPAFDEWQFFQSESLRHAFASALERLVEILNSQANYEQAIAYARRRLALDPLHEPV